MSPLREGPTRGPHGYRNDVRVHRSTGAGVRQRARGRPALGAPWAPRLPSRRRSAALDRALPDRAWDQHHSKVDAAATAGTRDPSRRHLRSLGASSRASRTTTAGRPGRLAQPCRPGQRGHPPGGIVSVAHRLRGAREEAYHPPPDRSKSVGRVGVMRRHHQPRDIRGWDTSSPPVQDLIRIRETCGASLDSGPAERADDGAIALRRTLAGSADRARDDSVMSPPAGAGAA
jgi:hypothetical protein